MGALPNNIDFVNDSGSIGVWTWIKRPIISLDEAQDRLNSWGNIVLLGNNRIGITLPPVTSRVTDVLKSVKAKAWLLETRGWEHSYLTANTLATNALSIWTIEKLSGMRI